MIAHYSCSFCLNFYFLCVILIGIMDMMKNLYEDGDENMRKIIGESMLKSQRGEKMTPDSMGDF